MSSKLLLVVIAALSIGIMASGCECMSSCKKGDKDSCTTKCGTCPKDGQACSCKKDGQPCSCKKDAQPVTVKKLTTPEMLAAAKDSGVTLVDARGVNPGMEMIPGALPVSYKATDAEIAAALKDKNARIVTYCANTRCTASPQLAERLVKMGYTNISEYPEGIAGWKNAQTK